MHMVMNTVCELRELLWKERDALRALPEEVTSTGWSAAKYVPSEIHLELASVKAIPEPYIGFNEHKVQWVGEREWLYKTEFSLVEKTKGRSIELVFEGLDTFCDVYLNNELVLKADNMFRTWSITLNAESLAPINTVLMHFMCAKLIAKELEKDLGRVRAGSCNLGDPSRVYVRKAQYHWRWDWGPEFMCCGPYRPIKLLTYSARLSDLYARGHVSKSLTSTLKIDVGILGLRSVPFILSVALKDLKGAVIRSTEIDISGTTSAVLKDVIDWDLGSDALKLWWPSGYGEQTLYDVDIMLLGQDGFALDRASQRIGFRRVELIQDPLSEPDQYGKGTTFLFEINNVRMFMGGSNWIPADTFLPSATPERLRAWLQLMRDGNQNMVRLWGGGVYEPDVFYDTCDELGILVWQDFQFSCGVYPAHDSFVASVKAEAEDNVKRIRHHPSLALLCGNNEDYQQVLQWGGIDELPARKIYEETLPEVVSRLTDPEIPYHRGSPYGGEGWDTSDPTIGDVHQWNIWAGAHHPYQEYDRLGGRFVSEFGMPAMPDLRTIEYWMQEEPHNQRYSQSKVMAQHNKAGLHERRFALMMNDNFRLTNDLEAHVYNTQMMQLEAVGYAYRMWRREWRGRGKEYCSGVLVWQLNDCWPVTSWAIVDYFLRPKPVYYAIARELRPVAVGILRTVAKNRETDRPRQYYEFGAFQSRSAKIEIWATNATLQVVEAQLLLHCVDLESEWSHSETHDVYLKPNQSTELLAIDCPCPPSTWPGPDPAPTTSYPVVVAARLVDRTTGEVMARYADWPQPYRFIDFPDPGLKVTIQPGQGRVQTDSVRVEVSRPLKGLVLSVQGDGAEVKWSENALDIMPNDPQTVIVHGMSGRKLKFAYMGKERATGLD